MGVIGSDVSEPHAMMKMENTAIVAIKIPVVLIF
jgi:hypothetical protein